MMRKILASTMPGALCLVLTLLPMSGLCHNTRLSSSNLTVTGPSVEGVIEVNSLDMEVALKVKLNGADGNVSTDLIAPLQAKIFEYLLAKARPIQGADSPCAGAGKRLSAKGDHLQAYVTWSCEQGRGLQFESTLFQEIDPAARHMLTVSGEVRAFTLLSAPTPRASLQRAPSKIFEVLTRYFLSGVEHIAIGYDHIAFLVAVILWGRRFWSLAAVVTAFTIAHSVTLSLAALDIFTLPSRWVEAMIALSIVYVAAENFFVRDIGRRWIITFLFGLVHGFGFASVLREFGIPQDRIGWALAAFNVGVEAGQLVIVALALAVLYLIGLVWKDAAMDSDRRKPFVWGVSGIILVLGLYWAAQRIWE